MKFKRSFHLVTNLFLLAFLLTTPVLATAATLPGASSVSLPGQGHIQPALLAGNIVDVQVGTNMFNFTPKQVTIHVGDTVRWTWVSDVHTVTSGVNGVADGKFCSPKDTSCTTPVPSNTGFVYQHTFTQAGTYPYYCVYHFAKGMTGEVIVLP
jgi:plastocyanin